MAIDFPASPPPGSIFTLPNGIAYTYDGTKWVPGATGGAFLPISGGTLTGPLSLSANPAVPLGAATKQYVDNGIAAIPAPLVSAGGSFMSATSNTSVTSPSGSPVLIPYNVMEFDTNSEFNPATYTFTAKRAGYYKVFGLATIGVIAGNATYLMIYKNGVVALYGTYVYNATANALILSVSGLFHLAVGDVIAIATASNGQVTAAVGTPTTSKFQINLLALG